LSLFGRLRQRVFCLFCHEKMGQSVHGQQLTVHTDGSVGTPSLHNHQRAAHTMSDKLTRIALVHDDKVSWCHRSAGPFHYGSLPVRPYTVQAKEMVGRDLLSSPNSPDTEYLAIPFIYRSFLPSILPWPASHNSRQECKKSCPVVKMGKLCIEVTPTDKKAFISEELCIGCGICVKK
jgi:ferredoxin